MVVVPKGSADDPTRLPAMYDETYGYLRGLGVTSLD